MAEREKLIEVKDLQISFGKGRKKFVAVDHVNFDIYKGETFSLEMCIRDSNQSVQMLQQLLHHAGPCIPVGWY